MSAPPLFSHLHSFFSLLQLLLFHDPYLALFYLLPPAFVFLAGKNKPQDLLEGPCLVMGLALGRRHHNSITSLVGHMAVGHWTTIENHIAEKSSLCSWSLLLSIIFGIFCTNFVVAFSGFCQNSPSTLNRPKLGEILIFVFSAVVKLKFQYFLPLGRL